MTVERAHFLLMEHALETSATRVVRSNVVQPTGINGRERERRAGEGEMVGCNKVSRIEVRVKLA